MGEESAEGSIVVAADGSDHAERALDWAAEQASLERRRLLVVSVGEGDRSLADGAAETAQRLHPQLSVEALLLPGDPRRVLIDLSSRARMLVMGSRGRGALKSMLLGSVSAAVSTQAACPVVVCRPAGSHHTTRGVIVGADGTQESLPVLEFAYRQSSLRGLPLTVMHCFWDAVVAAAGLRHASDAVLSDPDLEDLRALLAESVAGFTEEYPDVPVTLSLKHGLVDETLSPRGEAWDLIVVGRHPASSVSRVLSGSVAAGVLERARTTVAVVPEATSSS